MEKEMYRYLNFVQIPNSVFLCPASGRIPDMASRIFGYKKGQIYGNFLTSLVMYLLCRVVDTSPFHQRFIVISITDGQTFPPISRMAVATLRTRQRSARTPSPILDKTAVQMSIACCHGHGDTAHRTRSRLVAFLHCTGQLMSRHRLGLAAVSSQNRSWRRKAVGPVEPGRLSGRQAAGG